MIITVDGPVATGKSTVAKRVAEKLGFIHFDTGAMYRCLTAYLLNNKIDYNDPIALAKALNDFTFEITLIKGQKHYFVEKEDVTNLIRSDAVNKEVSHVAAIKTVREKLVSWQRAWGNKGKSSVFEGRDLGSIVFPKADLKIYLSGSDEVRSKRRYNEMITKFPDQTFTLDQVLVDLKERDRLDMTRTVSPLVKARDAVEIDTSNLTVEQVADQIVKLAEKRQKKIHFLYRATCGIVFFLLRLFYRLEVVGTENIPSGPCLIASNHSSYLDPPIVASSCPLEMHLLARASLFRFPIFGPFIRSVNAHPVDTSGEDVQALRVVLNLLKEGDKVLIFPEGGRSFTKEWMPFKHGLAMLSLHSGHPILPVVIEGAHEIWPKEKSLPKIRGRLKVTYLPLIYPDEFKSLPKKEAQKALTERLFNTMSSYVGRAAEAK